MCDERQIHPLPPIIDAHSRILILGSFPSVKSREQAFYYAHPQNRFWLLMAGIFEPERGDPRDAQGRRELLLAHGIALWDVIQDCVISGSADASIRAARPNPLGQIFVQAPIRRVICNGALSAKLYQRYRASTSWPNAYTAPSTSPANARYSLDELVVSWKCLLQLD